MTPGAPPGPRDLPVVVVGAGPTGMTAAVLLATYGVPVLVLDRHAEVYAQPRAVHLDDEVCRVLGRIGVAADFLRLARPALGLRLVDRDLHVLAEFSRTGATGVHGYPQANMFDQPDLERLLRARAAQLPLVSLRTGADVVGLAVRGDGAGDVDVVVQDAATGSRDTVRAAYVLGCDGAGSTVRRAIGSRMRDLRFRQRWLVVDVDTAEDLGQWEGVQQVCDPSRAATFLRVGERRYRWEFQLLDGESAEQYRSLQALHPLLHPWTRSAPRADLRLVRAEEYTFRAQLADRWRRGPVLLLGDAAHLTPPFVGQGLGAGLRDAHNLAWKLAAVRRGALPEQALDSYQAERAPHVRELVWTAIGIGVAMSGGGAAGQALRRLVLPRAHRVPGLRRRAVDSATPPLRRSSLLAPRRRTHLLHPPLVGTLAPNAVLADGRRLDDVSPGFLLVARTAPTPAQRRALVARGLAVVVAEREPPLRDWLRAARVGAAVVRPDGTVCAAGDDVDALLARAPGLPPGTRSPSPPPDRTGATARAGVAGPPSSPRA